MKTFGWDTEGITFVNIHDDEPTEHWVDPYDYDELVCGIKRYFKGDRFVFDSISTLTMLHGEKKNILLGKENSHLDSEIKCCKCSECR